MTKAEKAQKAIRFLRRSERTVKQQELREMVCLCAELIESYEQEILTMSRTFAEAAKVLTDKATADAATITTLTDANTALTANQKTPESIAAEQLVVDVTEKLVPSPQPAA